MKTGMARQMRVPLKGRALLAHPLFNKGSVFSLEEREAFGLHGLLPAHVSSVEEQLKRTRFKYEQKRTPLGKYAFLMSLLNRNEHLFYQFVERYAAEMLPYIYTPTVGEAAQQYSYLFSHERRGYYISYELQEKMEEMIHNIPQEEVDVVVVTDGERILGLGDLGLGGMAISIGKVALYTLFGGIDPAKTLPIVLDVGTNNEQLLKDELYLGSRRRRIEGAAYDRFVERFIEALQKRYGHFLLQWEDFGKQHAYALLNQYRDRLLSFNDDIQGTAAVALGAILSATLVSKTPFADQKVAIMGAGSAGMGIAEMLVKAWMRQGVSAEEAHRKVYLIDVNGLIHFNTPGLTAAQSPFAQPRDALAHWKVTHFDTITLGEVVANGHPTVLIGVCAQPGVFTKQIVQTMGSYCRRPIIFPMSNPTSKAEATPQELFDWTEGRAIVATGSPFLPVSYGGKSYPISQSNNVYIFPGVGLGALAAEASKVTDGMFAVAAETLASASPALRQEGNPLLPRVEEVRGLSRQIAEAVARQAIEEGVSRLSPSAVSQRIEERIWRPEYPTFVV